MNITMTSEIHDPVDTFLMSYDLTSNKDHHAAWIVIAVYVKC